jgi:hypothetical protein
LYGITNGVACRLKTCGLSPENLGIVATNLRIAICKKMAYTFIWTMPAAAN